MDKARIISEVRLQIETAREFDINRYIATALTQFNEVGVERASILTVEVPSKTYDPDPGVRTAADDFNYYPLLRCLILPNNLVSLQSIFYAGVELDKSSMRNYYIGEMLSMTYAFTNTNEIYLSFDAADGDEFQITGRWALRNLELLPDRYENWFMSHVLAGMYSNKLYKDADMFAIYEDKRRSAWKHIKGTKLTSGNFIAKDEKLQ